MGLLQACGGGAVEENQTESRVVVTVATATRGDLQDVANLSGVVVPSRAADLTIYATEDASIAELPKKESDAVAIGDILVRFEIPSLTQELAAMQLEVIESTTRLDRANTELKRQTELFERGITPRVTYDSARLEQSAAESGLNSSAMRLDALKKGDARSVVRATFPGVVMSVFHAPGDTVRADTTDPIMRVVDPTRVQVAVQVPVAELARVVAGQLATIRAIAGDISEPATVASKAQTVDPSAPTGEVRLAFISAATLPLDTPVSVELVLDRRSNTILVPAQAVRRDDLGTFVMVAGDDGLAHRQPVAVGLTTAQFAQISGGLEEQTRVILPGVEEISDLTPIMLSR